MYPWSEMPNFKTNARGKVRSGIRSIFARLTIAEFVVPIVVVTVLLFVGWLRLALVVGSIAFVIIVGSQFSAPFERAVRRTGEHLSRFIGTLLRWCLLAPFYVLIIAPLALIARLSGNDKLKRHLVPDAPSYWEKPNQAAGYERPY